MSTCLLAKSDAYITTIGIPVKGGIMPLDLTYESGTMLYHEYKLVSQK